MEIEFHPVADLFPLMSDEEFNNLVEDVKTSGLRNPILLHEGKIIDGRNRYKACKVAGITPRTETCRVTGSVVQFVVSLNLHRRHLSSSQKAIVAAKMLPILEQEAKERQKEAGDRGKEGGRGKEKPLTKELDKGSDPHDRTSTHHAAALTGSNRQYVSDAKKLIEKQPDLAVKVETGKITLPQAKAEARKREKASIVPLPVPAGSVSHPWRLINGDCILELQKLKKKSARLVFADPPYNIGIDYGDGKQSDSMPEKQYLDWCDEWMSACLDVLTDDGSFWVMICDEYADHFGVMLRKLGVHRRSWIKWYETFGVNCANKFNRTTRHIFYCVKDPKRFVFNPEAVSRPSDRLLKYNDKRANPDGKVWDDLWQIPRLTGTCNERIPSFPTQLPLELLMAVVGCASNVGDLVIDPFNGSGTTGAASIQLERQYIGIEKNADFYSLSNQRLQAVLPHVSSVRGHVARSGK